MLGWKTAMLRVVEVLSFCSIRMAAQGQFLEGFGKTLRNSAICCGELVLTPAWYYRWLLGWGIWSRFRLPTHFCRQGRHSEATGGKFVFTRMPKQQNVEGHDKDISKERSGWHWNVIITSRMLLDIIFCTMYLAANPVWSWLIRSLIVLCIVAKHRPWLRHSIWQQCNRWQIIERSSHSMFFIIFYLSTIVYLFEKAEGWRNHVQNFKCH